MSATSITEIDKEEKNMEDDLSEVEVKPKEESIDMDKLAALKAKSKAKQENELASKIVSKKERSLVLGVIGSGQAGCIDGESNIYVSDYGLISIKELFDDKILSSNFDKIQPCSNGVGIDIKDSNIYTVSIDPETGEFKKAKVLTVWKVKKLSVNKITLNNGTNLTCSKTHPSLLFRPKSKRKAFFSSLSDSNPITKGDLLFDARSKVLDQLSKITYVRDIEITEDIAWLLGFFAGDGSNKINSNEISFYSSDKKTTERIINICDKLPKTSISVYDRTGCSQIAIFGLQFRLFIEGAFESKNTNTFGGTGNKTYTISIPSCISAGYSNIRLSFLAGLIDSDGTVSSDWCETSIFTTSKSLADKTACLISSLGGRAKLDYIPINVEKNEKEGFKIKLSGKINHGPLMPDLVKMVTQTIKHERLNKYLNAEQQSFVTSIVPLNYNDISHWLIKDGGFINSNNFYEKSGVNTKNWVAGNRKLSIPYFDKMLNNLNDSDQISYLKNISSNLLEVDYVEKDISEDDYIFYDLTVETYENYMAGNNGLLCTHNSRIAESFYKLGYDAVVLNTAMQDLKHIDVPDSNKLLLEYGVGGAAKEMEIGKAAAEAHRGEIMQLVNDKLSESQVNILCLSLGGGSGAGSCETLVELLSDLGKPLVVMTVLPMDTEDVQTKSNALETLSKLAKLTQIKKVNNLIIVDNAKLEAIYHDVGQMDFYDVANKAIVGPIDIFNTLSSMPSSVKSLDPMEFSKLFIDGEGLTVYGELTVENFDADETAIAEAVVNNLNGNLLAGGFDLKQSRYVGVIIAANKSVWSKIPSSSITYAMAMVNDQCGTPKGVFKGIYTVESDDPVVKVYSMFSGLGLPDSRVAQLKKEAKELSLTVKNKDDQRSNSLNLDTGTNETVSAAQKIKEKIAAKSSAFGKLLGGTVLDRRK